MRNAILDSAMGPVVIAPLDPKSDGRWQALSHFSIRKHLANNDATLVSRRGVTGLDFQGTRTLNPRGFATDPYGLTTLPFMSIISPVSVTRVALICHVSLNVCAFR